MMPTSLPGLDALGLSAALGWLTHWPLVLPQFGRPWWLLSILLPLLPILLRWRRQRQVLGYAEAHLRPWAMQQAMNPGRARNAWRQWLLGLFWLMLVLALADPRVPRSAADTMHPPAPVMIVLDGSTAMSVRDVSPDRLGRTRQLVDLLAQRLPGVPVGLMLYSDRAGLLLPPSKDRGLLGYFTDQTPQLLTPTEAPRPDLAFERVRTLASMRHGAIVWLTSGDARSFSGALGARQLKAAQQLKQADIPVFAVVEGRQTGIMHWHDKPVTDDQGHVLHSKPNLSRVEEVARAAGGAARQTSSLPQDADFLAARLHQRPGLPAVSPDQAQTVSIHQLPLLLAVLSLLLALWPARPSRSGINRLGALLMSALLLGAGLFPSPPLQAASAKSRNPTAAGDPIQVNRHQVEQGQHALANGDFVTAQTDFASARGYAARLGAGISAYRRADYPFAVAQLQQALWLAQRDDERALVLFDLGDALVMAGRYQAALDAFNAVLALQPDNAAARKNRDIVAKMLQSEAKNVRDTLHPRGHHTAIYGYYHEPKHSKMSDEMLQSQGATAGAPGGGSGQTSANKPFRLTPQMATSARRKLDLVHDQPASLLRGLIEQQTYDNPTQSSKTDGGTP